MKRSITTGLSFGLTSGVITTLGLMVGLYAGTHSQLAVIGGILTIAVADALSDALGIHVSQESQARSVREVWEATLITFFAKLFFSLTFVIPVLAFELSMAILISVVWGLVVLFVYNLIAAKQQGTSSWKIALEHLLIGLVVVALTRLLGDWIAAVFGG